MIISDFNEVHKILAKYVPPAKSFHGVYTLDNVRKLTSALGNPQDSYKVIHIAGTSGKTSTAYYMAALLGTAKQKVGLTVSPHVDEVNERVQIDLVPLAEKEFCVEFGIFLDEVAKTGVKPTYFELLVVFSFWEFARQKVDYAIVEVGLGGLLDGTNVINNSNKVCIITDIGLDHTRVLGRTLPEIAEQKAGIIQKGNSAFTYRQAAEIMQVFEQTAEKQGAELYPIDPLTSDQAANNLPVFQRRNWNLAYQTYLSIAPKHKLPKLTHKQLLATTKTYIPARMEIIKHGKQTLILDGGHNEQKIRALVMSIREKYPNTQAAVLFSLKDGKELDAEAVVRELVPVAEKLIITTFGTQQDLPSHAIKPEAIAEVAKPLEISEVKTTTDPVKAYQELVKSKQELLIVVGSFYLLNQIRPLILKK